MHRSITTLLALSIAWTVATAAGAQEIKYVKKDTREATRQASLAASGAVAWPAKWYLIGPFDNPNGQGLSKEYPPEKEIKLDAKYPGKKGEQAEWRPFEFPDGQIHDLKR